MRYTFTLQESQHNLLHEHLVKKDGKERVAFIICGLSILNNKECRFLSTQIITLSDDQLLISEQAQLCWNNNFFIQALKIAEPKGFTVAVIHNHPAGINRFSNTDDNGEYHLFKLAFNRNGGIRPFASMIMMPDGLIIGRVWKKDLTHKAISLIRVIGKSIRFYYPGKLKNYHSLEAFHRQQLAFGNSLVQDISHLICTVVGIGATGSATALLLTRLGVGTINLIDKDIIEESNLNRLYAATKKDVGKSKVEVIKQHIETIGLGTLVNISQDWVSSKKSVDFLKGSDIIFGCTDDHAGRILLNRFAYFYLTPVIDMGLIISVKNNPPEIQDLQGRISYLFPGSDCLLTKGIINGDIAYSENLKRDDPEQYEKLKEEAYVLGEGNPAPSVVTFTTQMACMAVNELLNRMQHFNPEGLVPHKIHFFHRNTAIYPSNIENNECRICGTNGYWGRGDMEPFLDMTF